MPLSPREEELLATLEAQLRVDDPALAATLDPTSSEPSSRRSSVRTGLLLLATLLAALLGLVAASTLLGNRLGVVATAALTGAFLVPWLLVATRWAGRFAASRAALAFQAAGTDHRRPTSRGEVLLGVVVALGFVAVLPAPGQAFVGLVIIFGVLPWLFLRGVERIERRGKTKRPRRRGNEPT